MDNYHLSKSTNKTVNEATSSFVNIIAKAIANQVANQLANQINPLINLNQVESGDKILNIDEACDLLNLKKPTVYSKANRGELPYFKKGKHLRFSKEALLEYIHSGRVKTNEELQESALDYLNIKHK